MTPKQLEILEYLAQPNDYFKGLGLLQKYGSVPKSLLGTLSRRENQWSKGKIIYLLIKTALLKELNEQNYIAKSAELLGLNKKQTKIAEPQLHKEVKPKTPDKEAHIGKLKPDEFDIRKDLLPSRMTDKQYAEWFHKQPNDVQELIKDQSRLTRKRAVLHKECRSIIGNDKENVELRNAKLKAMDVLTNRIKEIHSIVSNFKVDGKLIIPEKPKEPTFEYDISKFSDFQKANELVRTKTQLKRMRATYEKISDKSSARQISRAKEIELKVKKISILQKWYDEYKRKKQPFQIR